MKKQVRQYLLTMAVLVVAAGAPAGAQDPS